MRAAAAFLACFFQSCWDAYWRFTDNDGWAIASHLALFTLLALFPFLIFVTALAGVIGSQELAEQVAMLIFSAWPSVVSKPLEIELHHVLSQERRDLLTLGGALMLWFSSSGVEAVRVGLNRAYGFSETRWWYRTRAQSIFFVVLGAAALLALAFLIVLAPTFFHLALVMMPKFAPQIDEVQQRVLASRYAVTFVLLLAALLWAHMWLPNGKVKLRAILPGVALTLLLWFCAALLFAWYLSVTTTYIVTYAGFASVLIALVFLYFISVIFIMGGEFNAAWMRAHETRPALRPTLFPLDRL